MGVEKKIRALLKIASPIDKINLADMFASLMLPHSDHLMIHLGGNNNLFCNLPRAADGMGVHKNRTKLYPPK